MDENLGSLIAGFGLCYGGGRLLGIHLGKMSSANFRNLVHRYSRNPWTAGCLGIGFSMIIGRSSILAMIIVSLITAGLMTVAQAFPMVVWGNVGGVLIVYLAVINVRVLAFFLLGIAGIAYGLGGKSKHQDLFGSAFAIGMLILGVVLVKGSNLADSNASWVNWLVDMMGSSIWLAFLLGVVLKTVLQSGFVIALLEISLIQAGLIDLAQVVAIFLGTRVSTSLFSWILSTPYRSAGKQLMMIQVFYNLIGSAVFLVLLYVEELFGLPALQWSLRKISADTSIQVASMALVYCCGTSMALTLVKNPLLALVDHLWKVSDKSEIGNVRYINQQALEHPETAIELADREQSGFMDYMILQMAEMRKYMMTNTAQSDSPYYHRSFQKVAKELSTFLIDLGNCQISTESFKRFLLIQERQGILTSLESHVYQFAFKERNAAADPQIQDTAMRFMEALDIILLTAQSVFETRSASENEILLSITGKRTTQINDLRKNIHSKYSQLDEDRRGKVMDMAILFEKTVWLVHLIAESIGSYELSGRDTDPIVEEEMGE